MPLNEKLLPTLARIEGELIKVAQRACRGRVDAAARTLEVSPKGGYLKRQRLGLRPAPKLAGAPHHIGRCPPGSSSRLLSTLLASAHQRLHGRQENALRAALGADREEPPFPNAVVDRSPRHTKQTGRIVDQKAAFRTRSGVIIRRHPPFGLAGSMPISPAWNALGSGRNSLTRARHHRARWVAGSRRGNPFPEFLVVPAR